MVLHLAMFIVTVDVEVEDSGDGWGVLGYEVDNCYTMYCNFPL